VKISLLMLVERDTEGRLTGVIFQEGQFSPGALPGRRNCSKWWKKCSPQNLLSPDMPGALAPARRPGRQGWW